MDKTHQEKIDEYYLSKGEESLVLGKPLKFTIAKRDPADIRPDRKEGHVIKHMKLSTDSG